ncbi:MAG: hypothetical protein Q7J06_00330 [Bacteroidales bacterium]|nr:hypothetical protein [Bacteroidales bacterium]
MINQDKKEALVHKTFKAMFSILVIFAVPAFSALFLGKFLQEKEIIKFNAIWPLLLGAFVLSWFLTFRLYFKISKEFKELEEDSNK